MANSTLSYLDGEGRINFLLVPWTVLNLWLSRLNGNFHVDESVENVNRGSLIEELEHRRKEDEQSLAERSVNYFVKRGMGKDWREYENDQGFTHLEELIIYQPVDWRKQAREYMYVYCTALICLVKVCRMEATEYVRGITSAKTGVWPV
jgi:hypothetical protein